MRATALPKGNYRAWVRAVSSTSEIAAWSVQAQFTIALLESEALLDGDDDSLIEVKMASLSEEVPAIGLRLLIPDNENFKSAPVCEGAIADTDVIDPHNDSRLLKFLHRPYPVRESAVPEDTASKPSRMENLDESLVDLLMGRLDFQAIDHFV